MQYFRVDNASVVTTCNLQGISELRKCSTTHLSIQLHTLHSAHRSAATPVGNGLLETMKSLVLAEGAFHSPPASDPLSSRRRAENGRAPHRLYICRRQRQQLLPFAHVGSLGEVVIIIGFNGIQNAAVQGQGCPHLQNSRKFKSTVIRDRAKAEATDRRPRRRGNPPRNQHLNYEVLRQKSTLITARPKSEQPKKGTHRPAALCIQLEDPILRQLEVAPGTIDLELHELPPLFVHLALEDVLVTEAKGLEFILREIHATTQGAAGQEHRQHGYT